MDENQFLETWNIHNRINLYLLEAIEPATLGSYSASKGRSVGEQFAHMHNVRLMWVKAAAPELLDRLAIRLCACTQQGLYRFTGTCQ